MSQINTQWSHFLRLWVIVDFDDISLEKYCQLVSMVAVLFDDISLEKYGQWII